MVNFKEYIKKLETNQLVETSLSRVWSYMEKYETGIITAFRYAEDCGNGKKYSRHENKQRNRSLLAKLRNMGYGVTAVQGTWINNAGLKSAETSYFVVDIENIGKLKNNLIELGTEFDQDAILWIPKGGKNAEMIATNQCENGFPGPNKVKIFSGVYFGDKGTVFTRVGDRPFIFKEDFIVKDITIPPHGFMGVLGCNTFSKMKWQNISVDKD
jgi:hypothetical protein